MSRLSCTSCPVTFAAVAMVGLAGCTPSEPVVTLTVAPPATSDIPVAPCVRDAAMTDAQALVRMSQPATGEVWFDAPVEIPAPAWAAGDPYLTQEWVLWYEIGTRGDRTILTLGMDWNQSVLERDAGGTYEWIAFPSARDDTTAPPLDAPTFAAITTNASVCYDSLTWPTEYTLPGGEPLGWYGPDFGTVGAPGMGTDDPLGPAETVTTVGDYRILRIETSIPWIWSGPYPAATEPPGLTYRHLSYVLETPYGMYVPLMYSPVGELSNIAWSAATTVVADGEWVYLADLNDSGCGPRSNDHETIVLGLTDADWTSAGTTPDGELVYVPSASNPLVQPMYNAYVGGTEWRGETPVSLAQFLGAPSLIGYRSVDAGELLVYLNGAYSGRAWC